MKRTEANTQSKESRRTGQRRAVRTVKANGWMKGRTVTGNAIYTQRQPTLAHDRIYPTKPLVLSGMAISSGRRRGQ